MKKILIIEDEEAIRMALEDYFRIEGFDVYSAIDGISGMEKAHETHVDIILLDIMLPRMDGFEVLKQLRKQKIEVPVIMISAKGEEIDRVLCLEMGADDYVTKPFSPRELKARVKAVMRRTNDMNPTHSVYQFKNIKIDFDRYVVKKNGSEVKLTAIEFELMRFLISRKMKVQSRQEILNHVWGEQVVVESRTVDAHISNLRKKLEDDPANPESIIGVRSVGYKFVD
jgi:two-component system alkaline phosphatase synthesis response regulator PhoP